MMSRPLFFFGLLSSKPGLTEHYRTGLGWTGLNWTGPDRTGLDWTRLVWSGLVWSGLVWSGLDWTGLSCIVIASCGGAIGPS
jgi:hypothetical protein